MTLRLRLRPTNRKIRLLVGLLLAGLFFAQLSASLEANRQSESAREIADQQAGKIEQLARGDHIELLRMSLDRSKQYQDYTCTLIKRERIGGVWKAEQYLDVKFMDNPFSVVLTWVKNAPIGNRIIYVEGKYDNMMLIRLKNGLMRRLVGTVSRHPDGREAMKNTLRPVSMFGFERGIKSLLEIYELAKRQGDLRTEFGGYAEIAGRKTIVLKRYLPAKKEYPAKTTVVYIDLEYLVPICIEGYNWDDQPSSRYVYKDVKFNVGLKEEDFLPRANGMAPPKK